MPASVSGPRNHDLTQNKESEPQLTEPPRRPCEYDTFERPLDIVWWVRKGKGEEKHRNKLREGRNDSADRAAGTRDGE